MTLKKNYDGVIPDSFFIGLTSPVELKNNGGVLEVPHASLFNPDGEDLDFQINSQTKFFKIDAGTEKIEGDIPFDMTFDQELDCMRLNQNYFSEIDENITTTSIKVITRGDVATTKTNSGASVCINFNQLRNNEADDGILNKQQGITGVYGLYSNVGENAKSNNVYGIHLTPYAIAGEIINMYDIYIADVTTGGTLTNSYGLYILGASKKNYLQGTLQAGGFLSSDGSAGLTTTFVDNNGNTITVKNGLITAKT